MLPARENFLIMLEARLKQQLQARKDAQAYRSRFIVDGPQGVELQCEGHKYLNFCSNDYLGLASHPAITRAFVEAANTYGVGSGAAHLVNGHSREHHALEEELAAFTGRERALLFSTGYMANMGVISALCAKGDLVLEDKLNHASLIDGALLSRADFQRFTHNDVEHAQQRLQKSSAELKLVVVDGIFSMDGDLAPLDKLSALCKKQHASLMVDDAHALACAGASGRGSCEIFNLTRDDVPILVGTLGKAFGTFGAFVAGSETLIESLIQFARTYVYTTALPPAVAAATRASLRLVQEENWRREKLTSNIRLFREQSAREGWALLPSESAIQPLILGDEAKALEVSKKLRERGIWVSAIRPPTVPKGSARLRITLSAAHEQTHILRLLEALRESL